MTIKDNKSSTDAEVPKDQTKSEEVVTGPITDDNIINDILGIDPAKVEDKKDDEKKESEASPKSDSSPETSETKPDEKPEEKKEESPESKETKPEKEVSEEKKPDETTEIKPASDEPFAKLAGKDFKTKEDLLDFATSQIGYNTWLTGQVKKIRPDLFNEDGSIKSGELQKAIAQTSANAEEASKTIAELGDKDPASLTDEQKEDIKKAREILKPLGVIFVDDPEFLNLKSHLKRMQDKELIEAESTIATFEQSHPKFKGHELGVAKLIEERGYSLERAWKVYKAENDIVEEDVSTLKTNPDENKKEVQVDNAIPNVLKKESGNAPASGGKDFMDDMIGMPGLM